MKETWEKLRKNPQKLEARNEKLRAIKNEEIPHILKQLANGKSKKQLAKELGVSRQILIRNLRIRGIPRNPKPPRYNPNLKPTYELGYVLGTVYGDGCCYRQKGTNAYVIAMNASDKEFVRYFSIQLCKVLGRQKPIPIHKWQPKAQNRKPQYTASVRSKKLGLFIKSLTIKHQEQILKTEDCKIGFLRGFFDSDGTLSLWVCHDTRKTPKWLSISICNTNKQLLEAVKQLFTSIGIRTFRISRMKMMNRWNKKPLYQLSFSSSKQNLLLFISRIGTRIKRKQKNVEEWKTTILPLLPLIEQNRKRKISLAYRKRLGNV